MRDASTWIIIYPRGDRSQIGIAEIVPALDYERADYAIAAQQDFYDDQPGAEAYARALAKRYSLTLHPDIPLLLDKDDPLYDEAAHDAFYAAEEAGTEVENTTTNLRFLLLGLYTSGCAGAADLNTDRGQALLDTLLDAAEGRAFKPFDFRSR